MSETAETLTVQTASGALLERQVDAAILPVYADDELQGAAAAADRTFGGLLADMQRRGEFRAKLLDTAIVPTLGWVTPPRILLLGLGERAKLERPQWTRAVSIACRALAEKGLRSAALELRDVELPPQVAARAAVEGAELARFALNSYQTSNRTETSLTSLTLVAREELATAIREGQVLGRAKNLARELVNEPANVLTPTELARRAALAAERARLQCEILDERQMERLEMRAIMTVTRGSDEPACMILLRHCPQPGPPALALVGKAVTFDTGGIQLKPRENMHRMKGDMAGGAAVLAAMQAIGELAIPVNVIGLIPAADNMPSGRAWKPGDVITTRRGKTVETLSTDAEGRMLLADALDYAQTLGAERLLDVATLTGACVVALGHFASGLYGNDESWVAAVRECGEQAGERHWPMPLWPEYRTLNRSEIADLKNSAGRYAGSIGAAWFLREFVDDRPWAHLDIAGSSWLEKGTTYAAAGPTGTGVGTFVNLARQLAGA